MNFFVDVELIFRSNDHDQMMLGFKIRNRDDQRYPLEHYHPDPFTWLMTDEEEATGSSDVQPVEATSLCWSEMESGEVVRFIWAERRSGGVSQEGVIEGFVFPPGRGAGAKKPQA